MSIGKEEKSTNQEIDRRQIELNILRGKILEAVQVSPQYWLIYKEQTWGLSTILNLIYKRSFVEVLFFTNRDVLEKGMPLLKIFTPIETEIDLNQIVVDPDFDDDGLVSPLKIIKRLNKIINREYRYHLSTLEQEVDLLNERYENYKIQNNPYNREIVVHFPKFHLKLTINFENFPLLPKISFSLSLSRVIKVTDFLEQSVMKEWDETNPLHIYEIVDFLIQNVLNYLKHPGLLKDTQHLIFDNVFLLNKINNISFKVHRGESLGIYFDSDKINEHVFNLALLKLYSTLAGSQEDFFGSIKVFGKHLQLLSEEEKEKIFILPEALDKKLESIKVIKAVRKGINVKNPLKIRRDNLEKQLKNADLYQLKDEIYEEFERRARLYRILRNWKEKKDFIDFVLEITGLKHKKDKKVSELTSLEYLLFSISRTLLQMPHLIIFRIPSTYLNRLEYDKFNEYIKKIKKMFHLVVLLYAPEEIISKCNEILVITEKSVETGSIEDYRARLPQSGQLVLVELDNPNQEKIEKLLSLKTLVIIEDRKKERYKIYSNMNSDDLLILLIQLFGECLNSFKKYQADLDDYVEYLHQGLNLNNLL